MNHENRVMEKGKRTIAYIVSLFKQINNYIQKLVINNVNPFFS